MTQQHRNRCVAQQTPKTSFIVVLNPPLMDLCLSFNAYIYSSHKPNHIMYTGIQHLHSFLSYLVLIGLLISFIAALAGWLGNKVYTDKDRKLGLLGLIPVHLQWVIGLILYFVSPLGMQNFSGEAMGDSVSRLYILEHPLTMIIAVILITVGYARAKRQIGTDNKGFKSIAIFYGIGLILILSRIPWNAWPGN